MENLYSHINRLFGYLGFPAGQTDLTGQIVMFALILLIAWGADVLCRKVLMRLVRRITRRTRIEWDDLVFNDKVMTYFSHLVPPVIIYVLIPAAFPAESSTLMLVRKLCLVYIIAVALRFVSVVLGVMFELASRKREFRDRPLKGVYQIIQVGLFFIGIIVIISVLIDKSPATLLAGLGASAAILMLVFKDSIMGLVSGIQLSANDMLRPGDWITMPKYQADGTVEEVTLNTVKVRNFDNTITMIPPYALTSDSFVNWRGMQESAGRRIKRSLNIDMTSVCFCTPEMLARYKQIALLTDYIERKEAEIRDYNTGHGVDDSIPVNGRHQTNLGVFRAYLERYLRSLPTVNQHLTCMVRQLQPTEKGIPLEVYFFSADKDWVRYEAIQADVFDHILAIVPEFGLRVFQSPTGADLEKALC